MQPLYFRKLTRQKSIDRVLPYRLSIKLSYLSPSITIPYLLFCSAKTAIAIIQPAVNPLL